MPRAFRFFILIFALATPAYAVDIPTGLSRDDVNDVAMILGHNTSSKFLSNPFTLGGHSGFEIGYSAEFVDTTDLAKLGNGTAKQSSFQFNRLTFGKGLYNNIDIFGHFIPFSTSDRVSDYGGILKWNFYQAKFLPFSVSILGHYSMMNIQDDFANETFGWDLLGGINLKNFALYWGAGSQRARSTFSRDVLDLTDPHLPLSTTSGTYTLQGSQAHSFIGLQIELATLFIAGQIDRYEQPVYSAKIGARF